MTITTAEYKAAIEAKIASFDSSTDLRDLTKAKSNADLWLYNNPTGAIAGYSSLETLIQNFQDDLTIGSNINDISFVGVSAFPPKKDEPQTAGYRERITRTTSGTWIVPDEVYKLLIKVQAAGASGWSSNGSSGVNGGGGGSAGSYVCAEVYVYPGDIITYLIGAPGIGVTPGGASGNNTSILLNKIPVILAIGGVAAADGGQNVEHVGFAGTIDHTLVIGGNGGTAGTVSGSPGGITKILSRPNVTSVSSVLLGSEASIPGVLAGGGGGGGGSVYGKGGNGGNGGSSNTVGSAPPGTSYGAGGGGGGGAAATGVFRAGGNGAGGIVEICY